MRQWSRARLGLMVAFLAFAPVPVFALDLDFTPDNSPDVADPTFVTPAHHFYGVTTLGYYDTTENFILPDGAISPHYTERQDTVYQQLSYGINDRLLVSASLSYGKAWETDTYADIPQDFRAEGFFNPEFTANWRVIAQMPERAPFNLDLIANYSPSIFAFRNASAGASGTLASGDQTAGLTIAASRKLTSLTLRGYITATRDGDRTELETSDGSTRTYSANLIYGAGFNTQFRFDQGFYIGVNAQVLEQTDSSVNDPTESVAFTRSYDATLDTAFVAGWQVVPNQVAIEAEYDHDYYGDATEQGASGLVGTFKDQVGNAYFLRLRYLIF